MQESHSAAAVANAFLRLARDEGKNLTNMQVQKLVFIAHGVHLGAYNSPLVHEHPLAWTFGPVIPSLYDQLRKYGSNHVTEDVDAGSDVVVDGTEADDAIKATWEAYKNYSGGQLMRMSHVKHSPWDIVWNSPSGKFALIPDHIIKDYYTPKVRHGALN